MPCPSYIRTYNLTGIAVCIAALAASLLHYTTRDPRCLFVAGLCQTFFLMEVANISTRKSNARYIPTVMQLVSRNFIMWTVFWYYGIVDWSFPVITVCWYLSDLVRYLFYTLRTNAVQAIRYNLFLITYPIGFLLEMHCLKILYDISGRVFSYLVAFIAFIYIPGFVFLFSHMLKQRIWSKKLRASRDKRKDL